MAYIETALVSSSGRLLIQLDDGTVIDAGYVKGERGPAGKDGADGSPGIPGARGEAGTNGAKWITGVGAPEVAEGDDGDLYLDVASSLLPLYQKVSGSWLFLANLKATPSGSGSGTPGGAAGGGGNVILFPKPDGGLPPSQDNDGNSLNKGDIWLDTNTGWLWVYDGSVWLPVGDRPPVIVQPNPPTDNNASDFNIQYPVRQGDLWFDSDQGALYVAFTNTDGDIVWVISTPANRDSILDEVPTVLALPTATEDREIYYNASTKTSYIYNLAKNQWIDISVGVGGGDATIDVGDDAPIPKGDGHLWFDTSENELTLYIYYGGLWVPAAPPVSLDGIKNSITSLEEVTAQLQADVASLTTKSYVDTAIAALEARIAELESSS